MSRIAAIYWTCTIEIWNVGDATLWDFRVHIRQGKYELAKKGVWPSPSKPRPSSQPSLSPLLQHTVYISLAQENTGVDANLHGTTATPMHPSVHSYIPVSNSVRNDARNVDWWVLLFSTHHIESQTFFILKKNSSTWTRDVQISFSSLNLRPSPF